MTNSALDLMAKPILLTELLKEPGWKRFDRGIGVPAHVILRGPNDMRNVPYHVYGRMTKAPYICVGGRKVILS